MIKYIKRLDSRISKIIEKEMAVRGHKISFSSLDVMTAILELKVPTFKLIVNRTELSKGNVSTICKKLISDGYINKKDNIYTLSEKGYSVLREYSSLDSELSEFIDISLSDAENSLMNLRKDFK